MGDFQIYTIKKGQMRDIRRQRSLITKIRIVQEIGAFVVDDDNELALEFLI